MESAMEIEFKILLTKQQYEMILDDYQSMIDNQYTQVNQYFLHPLLTQKKWMLRIRTIDNKHTLTLKQKRAEGSLESNLLIDQQTRTALINNQVVSNQILDILLNEGIDCTTFDTTHSLTTMRSDILLPEGVLSLDKNDYHGITDYELEYEVHDVVNGKKRFLEMMDKYHLVYQENAKSKVQRVLSTIKEKA